jgi:hypothetical protein
MRMAEDRAKPLRRKVDANDIVTLRNLPKKHFFVWAREGEALYLLPADEEAFGARWLRRERASAIKLVPDVFHVTYWVS